MPYEPAIDINSLRRIHIGWANDLRLILEAEALKAWCAQTAMSQYPNSPNILVQLRNHPQHDSVQSKSSQSCNPSLS